MAASSLGGDDDRPMRRIGLALHWGRRTRRLSLRTPVFYFGLAGLVLTALWSLGTTLYLFCGDDLVAAMLAREVSTQYDYENRLATLRTALERETTRHLLLQSEIQTQVRSLTERQIVVESRAAVLKTLTERVGLVPDPARPLATARPMIPNPLLAGVVRNLPQGASAFAAMPTPAPSDDFALRLGGTPSSPSEQADAPEQHSDAASDYAPKLARLSETLTLQEQSQLQAIAALRRPAQLQAGRIRAALARVGVAATSSAVNDSRTNAGQGLGGPFVPLPGDAAGAPFWMAVSQAGDDIAELGRLQKIVASVPLRQPLPGPLEVSSEFGPRLDPFLGRPALHTGIDLHGDSGARVYATAGGTVTIAERDGGYGNLVEIDHGNGLTTRYAHLSAIMVAPRQHVEAGEAIALVGSTGRATGPHLHYETRIAGDPVDPNRFLKAGALLAPADATEVARAEK